MKMLCLNVWEGGYLRDEIAPFFERVSRAVDIICLQEAYPTCEVFVAPLLSDFSCHQTAKYVSPLFQTRQMTLVRKQFLVERTTNELGHVPAAGDSLEVICTRNNDAYWISNVHGISRPGDKCDTPERILASEVLVGSAKREMDKRRIIMGDFNLRETTESVALFEKNGFRNLIKEYSIETTRNHHAWDKYPDMQMYSDYVFVGPEVVVKHFEVLPDIVSDHQPLFLEIA